MGRIVLGIIAMVASFMLADSIICNQCSVGLLGVCLNNNELNCSTSTSICFTARATFPSIPSFPGFNTQGCREAEGCAGTTNGTLLGIASYQITTECCDTDRCNPVQISAAPSSSRLSLAAALGAAAMASVWSAVWL